MKDLISLLKEVCHHPKFESMPESTRIAILQAARETVRCEYNETDRNALTQAEIDAMEALYKAAIYYDHRSQDIKECEWAASSKRLEFSAASWDFVPKAIARIRELEKYHEEIKYELGDAGFQIELLASSLKSLEEQTRWRHIDRERPKSGEICIIWVHKAPYLASYEGDEDSFAWVSVIDNEMVHDLKKYPHWQPLPKKEPHDE